MVVPVRVQPAVAVLPLCVRYPQVPGQISEQQAVEQACHPGGSPASRRASVRVICSSSRLIFCNRRNFKLSHRHLSFPRRLKTTLSSLQSGRTRLDLLLLHFIFCFHFRLEHAGVTLLSPPDVLLLPPVSARLCAQLHGEAAFVAPALRAPVSQ